MFLRHYSIRSYTLFIGHDLGSHLVGLQMLSGRPGEWFCDRGESQFGRGIVTSLLCINVTEHLNIRSAVGNRSEAGATIEAALLFGFSLPYNRF
jgi:hypothetical protein